MSKYKVDIHKVLRNISKGDMSFIDNMSDNDVKSVSPIVLQMWILGANSNVEGRAVLTDLYVNSYAFSLSNHPRLLLKLLCVANNFGEIPRFGFVKQGKSDSNYMVNLVQQYYNLSTEHAEEDLRVLTEKDLRQIGLELGLDKDELKKLDNAIIQRFGRHI
ncbi:MAG: hypothetical protein KAS32_20565 [Candidatus Peribacteraceae bacterium]|nr:hypothetical protein [Candidatus Peribacteraceae bacterium]